MNEMIGQTIIFAVLLLIMWTIVILLVWQDGREKKGTEMKDNDLISRSALLEAFGEEPLVWDSRDREDVQMHNDWLDYTKLVKEAPAVDAVEVVRCKDCKHWMKDVPGCTDFVGRCELANYMVGATGHCVYGERRADE